MASETYQLLDDDLHQNTEAGTPVTAELAQLFEKTGYWAKILAVTNFLNAVMQMVFLVSITSSVQYAYYRGYTSDIWISLVVIAAMLAAAILSVFNGIYLWRYALNINQALLFDDSQEVTLSFSSLNKYFKMLGWMTILFMATTLVSFLYFLLKDTSRAF
ncbi:MAG: hypothetical protein IT260_02935 [Saprospiraceae bacterium]|nr:hypothetical protein [Saprospiraceae bacterium]